MLNMSERLALERGEMWFFFKKNNFVKVNKKQMVDLLFYPTWTGVV